MPSAVRGIALPDAWALLSFMHSREAYEWFVEREPRITARDDVNEATLTGEAEPVAKITDTLPELDDALVAEVDRIIGDMHSDGTLTQLSEKWYDGLDLTMKIRSDRGSAPLTPEEIESWRDDLRARQANLPEAFRQLMMGAVDVVPVRHTTPAFGGLHVDSQRTIWVSRHPRVPGDPSSWVVLAADGTPRARLEMPPRLEVFEIGEDHVLGLRRLDDGVLEVQVRLDQAGLGRFHGRLGELDQLVAVVPVQRHPERQQVGLRDRVHHYPNQLSGGEQQRVGLARAFIHQPDILFADEPTGNLDGDTGSQIEELLFDLNRVLGTTLIIVTHDRELASKCDRIIELRNGAVVMDSLAEEPLSRLAVE